MPRIHVLTHRDQADPQRLADSVALVVDIVFATSGIAIAIEHGAAQVVPTVDLDAARRAAGSASPSDTILLGEYDGAPVEGFIPPWPLTLLRAQLAGKRLVYSTTNGTVALARAANAGLTLAASILNARAVTDYVDAHAGGRDVLVICAGSGASFSLEDFYGAGCLVAQLTGAGSRYEASDAALAARLLYAGAPASACIERAYAGRVMIAQGRRADLDFCRRESLLMSVPVLRSGALVRG